MKLNLKKQLTQQEMAAEIPRIKRVIHFVGLVDTVDSLLNLPKVLGGDVVTSTTKFTLKADTRWVERDRVNVGLWRTASWGSVVVAVTKVASAVIEPATYRVDEARWVKFADSGSKAELCVIESWLAPAFIVYDLKHTNLLAAPTTKRSTF
jgi:hypothetical protein